MTPAQTTTVFVVFIVAPIFLLAWEVWTLRNSERGDHITAALRAFTQTGLGKLALWLAGFIQGAVMGHIFHAWG